MNKITIDLSDESMADLHAVTRWQWPRLAIGGLPISCLTQRARSNDRACG